ncbi:phosphatidylglycerol lysyltransferase domain-containing protein [Vagococcus zengguangii]|nr:phosphatidylglycerol lysyltransferase domain-containing protein [Vagococcus zengguangii]
MKKNLKYLFPIAIFLFSIFKLKQELSLIGFKDIYRTIHDKSFTEISLLVISGLIGVAILCLYDVVLVRSLKIKPPHSQMLKISWISNALNNLIGFGGIVGASIRYNYFSQFTSEENKNTLKKSISLLLLSMITGVGVLSLLIISKVFTPTNLLDDKPFIKIALTVLAILLPIFIVATHVRPPVAEDRWLPVKYTVVSVLDYAYVGFIMFLALRFVGVEIDFWHMESVFIIATIAGLISMVPGGLGSFDVIFLLGMTRDLGRDEALVGLALIFYRLVYYIIPFLLGLILSLSTFQGVFKDKIQEQPVVIFSKEFGAIVFSLTKQRLQSISRLVLVFLFCLISFFYFQDSSVSILYNRGPRFEWLTILASTGYVVTSLMIIPNLIGIYRGSKEAYRLLWIQLIVLLLCQISLYVYDRYYFDIFFTSLLIISLSFFKRVIVCNVGVRSVIEKVIWVGTALVYLIQILYVVYLCEEYIPTKMAKIMWSIFAITLLYLIAMIAYRYYLRHKLSVKTEINTFKLSTDKSSYRQVLAEYSGTNLAHLGLLPANQTLTSEDLQMSAIYQENNHYIIILGDPFGDEAQTFTFIQQLDQLALSIGKQLIFYQTTPDNINIYNELKYKLFNLGEEGEIDLATFSITGNKGKIFRQLLNKQEARNLTFGIEPVDDNLLDELRVVSDAWLGDKKEMSFSIGNFDEEYIRASDCAVIRDEDKQVIGFATLMPTYSEGKLSVDLIRWQEQDKFSMMDLLYLDIMLWAQEQGYQTFVIGMAPLSSSYENTNSFLYAMTNSIYQNSSNFYSFKGLRHAKNKFKPIWYPKYLVYPQKMSLLQAVYQSYRFIHPNK